MTVPTATPVVARSQHSGGGLKCRRVEVSACRKHSGMPTAPLSFAKSVFNLIVLSRYRIKPSRCGRTDRPADFYKARIRKSHDAIREFLAVESWGGHIKFYCGDSENESPRSDPNENSRQSPARCSAASDARAKSALPLLESQAQRSMSPSAVSIPHFSRLVRLSAN